MILSVQVKPGKRFDKVERTGDRWVIFIRARAKDNQANEYLLKYLSRLLEIPVSRLRIHRGHASRIKQIEIESTAEYVLNKLKANVVTDKSN